MSSAQIREPANFGKRREPHTVIVTRNGKTRKYTVNPFVFSIGICAAIMMFVGYFSATAYLVFRDDLISASFANQARIKHEYEDRIAALRTKLDRVTSRQLLDQQAIEARVQELMARQDHIGSRNNKLTSLVDAAEKRGLGAKSGTGRIPVPVANPAKAKTDTITTGSLRPNSNLSIASNAFAPALTAPNNTSRSAYAPDLSSDFTQRLFGKVAEQIGEIDTHQRMKVDQLRIAAASKADQIASLLKSAGVSVPQMPQGNVGGPFVPLDHSVPFETHLEALESTLKHYDDISHMARRYPFANPIPGAKVSSNFGYRKDPFNGRSAMHSGTDFRAASGTPVLSTGDGIVVSAGRRGGYGKVVEVRHKEGYTTRYAHLSRITVKNGQRVKMGQQVGKVGSTGRSTGPHLHYEVRKHKKARNPARYMKLGSKLRKLM